MGALFPLSFRRKENSGYAINGSMQYRQCNQIPIPPSSQVIRLQASHRFSIHQCALSSLYMERKGWFVAIREVRDHHRSRRLLQFQ